MTTILTNLLPLAFGYIAKFMAIRAQVETDRTALLIKVNVAKEENLGAAREVADNEDKGAKVFRRTLVFVVLSFVLIIIVVPPMFDIPLVVQMKDTTSILYGLIEFDTNEFKQINGLLKFTEIFDWSLMILEFYFGGQMAKAR